MSGKSPTVMKMPEVLVFLRAILLGAVLFEVFWVAYLGAEVVGRSLAEWGIVGWLGSVSYATALPILFEYTKRRGCINHAARMVKSHRFDLLLLVLLGGFVMHLFDPLLVKFHDAVSRADILWAPTAFAVLMLMLISPIWRELRQRKHPDTTQLWFLSDDEIKEGAQDALGITEQAKNFADTVLASGARSGLVFGIDGPWGGGKTSFLNLAKERWEDAAGNSVIVFTFEPLRYASEPDLSERFIRDLCAEIRKKVFVPELLPSANRYSRMLKGKTDFSVLGFKFSLEPSTETIDELLEDIDDLLKQMGRRLIVIVDDLDRLEGKLVNNVLFTVRRTFKLNQATYILCYDTESLLASTTGKDEGVRAREFLEKFITAKLTLCVDLSAINAFLGSDWHTAIESDTVSPTVMLKLSQIMNEIRTLLAGNNGHHYVPLLGNLRKVKRFVNAALLMNMEEVKLDGTDFVATDLIHLMLLNLNYPGLFHQIYAAETGGRKGPFGVQHNMASDKLKPHNGTGLEKAINDADEPAKFLLQQLFDVQTLRFPYSLANDEMLLRSRACFNWQHRNLENYLQLIVRLKVPEPMETHRFYKVQVEQVMNEEKSVADVLQQDEFALSQSTMPQVKFWDMLIKHAAGLKRSVANNTINTLVEWLPKYSSLEFPNGMRHRAIDNLVYLLEQAGFGDLPRNGRPRDQTDLPELATRLIGNGKTQSPPSLIRQLVAPERGPLGWNDLMLLRMYCSPDVFFNTNICTALARQEDPSATVFGVDHDRLANDSMRGFSQSVFAEFKRIYIDGRRNFFLEVDDISDDQILGEGGRAAADNIDDLDARICSSRAGIKSFVIYHLTNKYSGNMQGVGCGRYDESGTQNGGGIRQAMTKYLLEFCFNPIHGLKHTQAFASFCFCPAPFKLTFTDGVDGPLNAVTSLLGKDAIADFWSQSGDQIKQQLASTKSAIYGYGNFKMTYEEWLPTLFADLDQLLVKDTGIDTKGE